MGSATEAIVAANPGGTSGTANPPPTTVEGAFMRFFGEQLNKHGKAVSRNVLAFRAVKNTLAAFEETFQGTEIIRRLLASTDSDIIKALGLSTDVSYHFPDMLPVFASYSAADRRELGANIEAILKLHTIEDGGSYKKGTLPGSGGMTETEQIRLMGNARKSFEANLRRLEKTSGSEDPTLAETKLTLVQKQIAEINNQGPEARAEHKIRLKNLERQETLLKNQIAEQAAEREAKRLEKEKKEKISQAMREKINELLPKLWAAINNYDPTKPESRDSIDAEMAAIFSGILEVGDFSDPDEMMKVLQPLQALLEQKETRHKEAAQTKKEEEEEEAKSFARGRAMDQLGNMFSYQSYYGSDTPPEVKDVSASQAAPALPASQAAPALPASGSNEPIGGGNAFLPPRAASRGIYEILNNKGVNTMARNNGSGIGGHTPRSATGGRIQPQNIGDDPFKSSPGTMPAAPPPPGGYGDEQGDLPTRIAKTMGLGPGGRDWAPDPGLDTTPVSEAERRQWERDQKGDWPTQGELLDALEAATGQQAWMKPEARGDLMQAVKAVLSDPSSIISPVKRKMLQTILGNERLFEEEEAAAEPGTAPLEKRSELMQLYRELLDALEAAKGQQAPNVFWPPDMRGPFPRTQEQLAAMYRKSREPAIEPGLATTEVSKAERRQRQWDSKHGPGSFEYETRRGRLPGGGGDPYHKSMELDLDGSNNNNIEEDEVLVEDISLMPPHPLDCGFVPPMPRGPSPAVIINVGTNGGSR